MRGDWTFGDLDRLTREAFEAADEELLSRIYMSDNFEPSLDTESTGLAALIICTKQEKAENRARVLAIFAERDAIKARWTAKSS